MRSDGVAKARRQEVAAENAIDRVNRTPAQQLAKLDKGGHRAVKERARLEALIVVTSGKEVDGGG